LLLFSPRWCRIHLTVPFAALSYLRSLSVQDVQVLQTIEIIVHSLFNFDFDTKILAFLGAPSLQGITLYLFPASRELPLPWHQLTELSLVDHFTRVGTPLAVSDALDILSKCVSLRTARLSIIEEQFATGPAVSQSVTLAFLNSLSVVTDESDVAVQFFELLSLPQLRSMRFRGYIDSTPSRHPIYTSLVTLLGLSPLIEQLDLPAECFPTDQHLAGFLQHFPSLKQLRLLDVDRSHFVDPEEPLITSRLLTHLTPSPGGCICPFLTDITFKGCFALPEEALLEFIKARRSSVFPGMKSLERIVVEFSHGDGDVDFEHDLQPLISAGLSVSVTYEGHWASPWDGLTGGPNNHQTSVRRSW